MSNLASSPDVDAYCSTGSSPGGVRTPASSPGTGRSALPSPGSARTAGSSRRSGHAPSHRPTHHPTLGVLGAPLTLERSGRTVAVPVRYECVGPDDAPVVVVLGGISAGRHLTPTPQDPSQGWWPGVVGPGGALDPVRHRLLGIDWIGGAGTPWRAPCPITPGDQARALEAVLDHLNVDRATLVGASYGGMVALAFAAAHPHRVRDLLVLCAAHRSHPGATAVRSVQRGILRLGLETGRTRDAVALARALAMTTYRTPEEFEERFAWADESTGAHGAPARDVPRFPVDHYLEARGDRFADRFDAEAYLTLCTSIDLHAVDPAAVTCPTTLVSVDSDALAPPWLVDELARSASGVRAHVRLSSLYGHDAFLKEVDVVSAAVRRVLAGADAELSVTDARGEVGGHTGLSVSDHVGPPVAGARGEVAR